MAGCELIEKAVRDIGISISSEELNDFIKTVKGISTLRDREEFGDEMKWKTGIYSPLPVDRFPPNPLGCTQCLIMGLSG